MTIHGWDASHYDWTRGAVDVAGAVIDGMAFITHKVSEGGSYVDPKFGAFAGRARAHSGRVLLGGYAVNRQGDQRPQVDNYIRVLDASAPWWRDGDWLVQLDCERWSNSSGVYAYEPRLAEIRQWCSYFMERTGSRWKPIVYAPKWTYGDSLRGLEYPLWASNYGTNPGMPYRQAYPGDGSSRWAAYSGQTPAILQYGSKTMIGSQSTCDANAYRGSLAELVALTRGPSAGPTALRTEPQMFLSTDPVTGKVYASNADLSERWEIAPSVSHRFITGDLPYLAGLGVVKLSLVTPRPEVKIYTFGGITFSVWQGTSDLFGKIRTAPPAVTPVPVTHEQLVAALTDVLRNGVGAAVQA